MDFVGKEVWAPDPFQGFIRGRLTDIGSDFVAVLTEGSSNKVANFPYSSVFPAEDKQRKDVDDNCALMYLNQATLLNNIRVRYGRNQIYTYVANILIAVNPYFDVPGLYTETAIKTYQGKSLGVLPPHVFAIADKAYRDMKRLRQSQSVIVSGESGAGKTESQKYILRFFCESWGSQAGDIEKRILETNPILEAFGNAKTLRNNNSSRFGKFVEIHFNAKYHVSGGFVSHYLLEKSRICRQQREERNYHVFYQLCAGASESLRRRLRVTSPDQYNYLRYGCTQFFCSEDSARKLNAAQCSETQRERGWLSDPVVDDVRDWERLERGLEDIGLTAEERLSVSATVAAVLHLGNIRFLEDPEDTRGGCGAAEGSEESLCVAAELLGVESEELRIGLTSRVMQASKGGSKGTVIRVPLKVTEAQSARDALAKAVYSRLFDFIVARINRCIPFSASDSYIGVLDIAGFEYFTVNDFEQFCINYCNEKLQQFFNNRILRQEQELYEKEGLGIRKIPYMDNQDCIDLIEERGSGILAILDEESKLPRPNPQHFTTAVHQRHKGHFRLAVPRTSKLREHRDTREDEGFLVRHFAGAVCYQTMLFIEKNNDALHASLEFLVQDSRSPFVRNLFQSGDSKRSQGKLGFVSVGSKFRSQLRLLMDKLDSTGTHFVRCIKPNSSMAPHHFEGGQILSQLQCSGMISVLELMQYGFPSRTQFSDLYEMYKACMPRDLARLDPRLFCKCLFKALGLNEHDFKFGLTKVFFRPGKFAEFDQMLRADPENLARLVAKVRQWLLRIRWKKVQYCALSVIKLKNKILWRRAQVVRLQSAVRGWRARRRFRPKYLAIMRVKSLNGQLTTMREVLESLRDDRAGRSQLHAIQNDIHRLVFQIRDTDIGSNDIDNHYRELLRRTEASLNGLREQAVNEKTEESRLKQLQQEMEFQQKRQQQEEVAKREAEENKKRKTEMERRRREEESLFLTGASKKEEVRKEQEDRMEQLRQIREQEARDHELALRLAIESKGHVDDIAQQVNGVASSGKYDLATWKYADLRDVINTSNDVELLKACRDEFHRRLKAYQQWKQKNKKQNETEEERFPAAVKRAEGGADAGGGSGRRVQRFFRIPFSRPADRFRDSESGARKTGYWFAHFDGLWVSRQMELHPDKIPVLLIAGRDDMSMCELELEKTGLTRKRGAEILATQFEQEWRKHGGAPYSAAQQRAPSGRNA